MQKALLPFLLLPLGAVCGYVLYIAGFLEISAKSALFYAGSAPLGTARNRIHARFTHCNGQTKRVARLEAGWDYCFQYTARVTKGSVTVAVQGRGKRSVVILNDSDPSATLHAEPGERYSIVTRFVKADGEYTLHWEAQSDSSFPSVPKGSAAADCAPCPLHFLRPSAMIEAHHKNK